MKKTLGIFTLIISLQLILSCARDNNVSDHDNSDKTLFNPAIFNPSISARINLLLDHPVDSQAFPRSLEPDGMVRGVSSSDWTSGFLPGSLLYLHQITGDVRFLNRAEEWLVYLEREKTNGKTHDMGFKINSSFGNALKLTDNAVYKEVMIQSAETLASRFNPNVGCIKSWDFGTDKWQFPVIIDNMMNLELLFEATNLSGDSLYYDIAVSHATKTLENHFRADNSSYHVIDYDARSGEVLQKLTHQGYSAESSWSRGQAWGLYGFTMVYRYTQDSIFLNQAIKIADFILAHPLLPDDRIPYWDLNDPGIPNVPKDASAAAVMASALIELNTYTNNLEYKNIAKEMLTSMSSSNYVLNKEVSGPFLLDHSVGNMPKSDEIDVPINYADYYFLEAVIRLKD